MSRRKWMNPGRPKRCDEQAGGCGRSEQEGAVLRDGSALCGACEEAIAEVSVGHAIKVDEAQRLVEAERKLWCRRGHRHASADEAIACTKVEVKDWKGQAKPQNVVFVQQLADAFHEVGKVNHYMVGVSVCFSDADLEAAEQVLIDRQNAGPQKGQRFQALERALDAIEAERTKRKQALCRA